MGDDPHGVAPTYFTRETVEQCEKVSHVGRVSGESLAGRFGERPTGPRLVYLLESRFQMTATWHIEIDPARDRFGR
jgi:hypothetical protein